MKKTAYFPKTVTILFVLGLVVLSSVLSGCDLDWRCYSSREDKFSILLPRTWEVETGVFNTAVLAREYNKDSSDTFKENINLGVAKLSQSVSLGTFFELNKDELMSKLAIYNPEEDEVFAGMLRGQMLTFECFGKGDRLKVRIAIFMKDDRAYIITCTSEANKFPRYEPLFMKAIRSFRSK